MKSMVLALAVAASAAFVPNALAQDAAAGEGVFKKCAACHNADTAKNKVGPHLLGIVGREAGAVEDFKYSKALVEQAEAGLVWDADSLAAYLEKPSAFMKGTKMSFAGLRKEEDIANVIAYLEQFEAE